MKRVVALKVVREDAVASPDAIARFHREMKTAAVIVFTPDRMREFVVLSV